jgi:hypothetical protein
LKRLRKIILLSQVERRLLIRSALLMPAFRLGLWLLPFRTLVILAGQGRSQTQPSDPSLPDRVAWAVRVIGRYVPRATCLVQALTAQALLMRSGFPSNLRIGVAKAEERFQAHAWVESQGRVIAGAGEIERYTPLLGLER